MATAAKRRGKRGFTLENGLLRRRLKQQRGHCGRRQSVPGKLASLQPPLVTAGSRPKPVSGCYVSF